MSESIHSADKIHTSISHLTSTIDEAFSPLEAFQKILDGANVKGAECHPVYVATVIEVLTEQAKQKISDHIDTLLEEYPSDEEAWAAVERNRDVRSKVLNFMETSYADKEFSRALSEAVTNHPEELKRTILSFGQTEEPEGVAMTAGQEV